MFRSNIGLFGRVVRGLSGLSALVGEYLIYTRELLNPELEELEGTVSSYLWETFCEMAGPLVELSLVLGGSLLVFSGVKGWCLLKATGVKTPL